MSSIASKPEVSNDEFWWQGSLMRIKARAADSDGALGLVEGTFYEGFGPPLHVHHRPCDRAEEHERQTRSRCNAVRFSVAGHPTRTR